MANPIIWKNVAVSLSNATGLAAAKTVTAITLAAPGKVSSTAHGYSNGAYVLMEVQGMTQINRRIFRVANQTANDFEMEDVSGGTGIDTTSYDPFSSGTAKLVTFAVSIGTINQVNSSGGAAEERDGTTIHDNQRVVIYGLPGATAYTFGNIWDPTDSGLNELKKASDSQGDRAFKFVFGTGGRVMVFFGKVSANLAPGGSAQDIVTTDVNLSATGSPTYYAA